MSRGLTRIERAQRRQDILVYDMEWYPGLAKAGDAPRKLGRQGHERGLRLVGLYDGEKQMFFEGETPEAMLDAFFNEVLTNKNSDKWIYAHYGGMADMQFLLRHIVEKGGRFSVDASFSGSSAIIVKVTRGESTWTFIDSFWLLRDRLEKLGESVGIKKLTSIYECPDFPACGHIDSLEEPFRTRGDGRCDHFWAHSWFEQHGNKVCEYCGEHRPKSMCVYFAPMNLLKTYNEQDCLILYRAIKQFEDTLLELGGELQMTIASCAMRLFRRRYLPDRIRNKGSGSERINDLARGAYTSSRVEVFQRFCPSAEHMTRVETLHKQCAQRCFDAWKARRFPHAEAFPFTANVRYEGYEGPPLCVKCVEFAMHARAHYYDLNSSFPYAGTFPMPGNLKKRRDGALPRKADAIYIADCKITVPPQYLPPIPYRHKGRVFFPFGTWRAWFSSVDLELLEERGGRIEEVYESIEFHPQTYLRDYMLDIYERRKNAKSDYEKLILKYLLNSLYGKFSERPEKKSMLLYPTSTSCPHTEKHRCEDWPSCEHGLRGVECSTCMEMLWPGCFLVTNESSVPHEWVPIGVHLTAIARKNLYMHLVAAQEDVYYADTDSCITTVELPSDPKTLGALKLEEDIWDGEFVAPKIYSAKVADAEKKSRIGEDIVKAKGFSRMTYAKFQTVVQQESVRVSRMTRILELYRKAGRIHRKLDPSPEDVFATEPEESVIEKRLVQKMIPKRCPLPGGQTRPWAVHEIGSDRTDSTIVIRPGKG